MNNYPEDRIGLVIKSADSVAKCISIIRKYNPVSMSEIKTAMKATRLYSIVITPTTPAFEKYVVASMSL